MKIGMFTNSYKPINDSGVVNAIDALRFGLNKLNQEVYIFAPKFPHYKDKENGIYRYPSITLPLKVKYPVAMPFSFKISKTINQLKLDIIHTHHPFNLGRNSAYFAKKYKIPLIFTNHTRYEDYSHYIPFNQYISKKVIRYLHKKYLNKCDCIIAPTQSIKEYLLNIGINSRIEIIPNCINFNLIEKSKSSKIRKLYRLKNKKVLLYMGRLAKEKNINFLIEAFKILSERNKNVALIICGGGYEEKNLKNLIQNLQLQDRIIMAGNVPHSEVFNYYSIADLFITASITEVFPLTLLEALSCGVPIVALKESNLQDIIKNGQNGFLTEDSIKSFSEQIEEILNDENLLKKLKKNAKLSSTEYTTENVSRKLLTLYKSLI